MGLLSHWSAPQWALPTAADCQRVTASGPIQPLVGTSVGSTPKQPTVSEQPLVRAFQLMVCGVVVVKQRMR